MLRKSVRTKRRAQAARARAIEAALWAAVPADAPADVVREADIPGFARSHARKGADDAHRASAALCAALGNSSPYAVLYGGL